MLPCTKMVVELDNPVFMRESEALAFEQHKEQSQGKQELGQYPPTKTVRENSDGGTAGVGELDENGEDEEMPFLRIVKSNEQVLRPSLRTGVPIDLVDPQEGGALDELYRKMREQAQTELEEEMAEESEG